MSLCPHTSPFALDYGNKLELHWWICKCLPFPANITFHGMITGFLRHTNGQGASNPGAPCSPFSPLGPFLPFFPFSPCEYNGL
ncbi:hypothetical protein GDO81_000659 [Engystomops pustulosus]|uniref:Uncharacterized protein n=1 Tax=Engystomops pustulosus TaxID=76066 RepID=A0AAV7D7T4_ENGPU|nr:hypothetical protein GDO81_000659 [Engystomops pustulosus]